MRMEKLEDVLRYLPIKGEVAFAGGRRNRFSEKIKKRQLKILRDYVDDLKHILEEGEEILLATRASSPFTAVEQLTTGGWIYHIKKCLLVLTDCRLLHFPSDYRFKPRNSVAQVRFHDLESVKGKRRVTFRYKNGVKEIFSQVKYGKRLTKLLRDHMMTSSQSTQYAGRQHLCPRCVAPLARYRYTCPRCRLEFRDPKSAVIYSIFLPGGGYFYTRHLWLGISDATTELILTFFTFVFILKFFLTPEMDQTVLFIGLILGGVLTVEKMITVYHAKHFIKEYIPVEKRFNRIPQEGQTTRPKVVTYRDDNEDEKYTFL